MKMSRYIFGACLVALGLVTMLGGVVWNAKCRNNTMACCVLLPGLGISCR
jgi:hypothetical protein